MESSKSKHTERNDGDSGTQSSLKNKNFFQIALVKIFLTPLQPYVLKVVYQV